MTNGQQSYPADACALVKALERPCLFSRSIKFTPHEISPDRWLITLPNECCSTQNTINETLKLISPFWKFSPLRYPEHPNHNTPTSIHFGCDKSKSSEIQKVYFEYGPDKSKIVFIAQKSSERNTEVHFYCDRPLKEILPQLNLPCNIQDSLNTLTDYMPSDAPALDVKSQNSQRHSIDINLINIQEMDIVLQEIQKLLISLGNKEAMIFFNALNPLTHISIGTNSTGIPFVTLYGPPLWLSPNKQK